ncbi:MAG: hypothetical protein WCK05_14400, partial [Planctomycetota bacterium]
MPGFKWLLALLGIIVVGMGTACSPEKKKPETKELAPALSGRVPAYINNTVEQYAVLQGTAGMPVQGWGIVIGLGRNGSSEVPQSLKEYLIKQL